LRKGEEQFRREKRRQAQAEALEALGRTLGQGEALFRRKIGPYPSVEDVLKSRSARIFPCPECKTGLCSGNWYQVGDHYLARGRCAEHGRYYTCLSLREGEENVTGGMCVYDETVFSHEDFQLCKRGGERIVVGKTPRKRKRPRRKSVKARAGA
jgi:hypothetical protein